MTEKMCFLSLYIVIEQEKGKKEKKKKGYMELRGTNSF